MHLKSSTRKPCCELCDRSGCQEQGLYTIVTDTGQHLYSKATMGQLTLYTAKKVSLSETLSPCLHMVYLGILVPLSIRLLKAEFPAVEQPSWYADYAGADRLVSQDGGGLVSQDGGGDQAKFWTFPGTVKEYPSSVTSQLGRCQTSLSPGLWPQSQHGKPLPWRL